MPRLLKAEREALKAVLDSEWESEDGMIKALMQAAYGLLEQRDSYGLAWGRLAVGPIFDKRQAEKLAKQLDDAAIVAPITSVAKVREWIANANLETDGQHCDDCRHPKFAHREIHIAENKKQRIKKYDHIGCLVNRCSCTEVYDRKDWNVRTRLGRGAFSGQATEQEDDENGP